MSSPQLKLAPGAIVCNESDLRGDIAIGTRTVVHPKAVIWALDGPIFIGDNNLIEEQARIINKREENADKSTVPVMIIGNNNVFEVECHSNALKIGDNNVLEAKSFVGRRVELTNGCIIGAGVSITTEEVLAENCVLYGSAVNRWPQVDRPAPQTQQIEFLAKVLPNYHYLKKPMKTK